MCVCRECGFGKAGERLGLLAEEVWKAGPGGAVEER